MSKKKQKVSDIPLRVAILWHQHQPDYRAGKRFAMPWVWLHATKDYLEMAEHLERHPGVHATINLVPSLIRQIECYLDESVSDPIVALMRKPAASLSEPEKKTILATFFMANRERVIARSPRYTELAILFGEEESPRFGEQEYIDLAVHFSLAWTGEIARQREPFRTLITRDRDFSEEDKIALYDAQRANVATVLSLHTKLNKRKQVELTTTPYYHPILPLIVDTNAARDAMPGVALPEQRFCRAEDARHQLVSGKEYFAEKLATKPVGLWPSEGSLSEAALELIREAGYVWTATDEQVLANSIGEKVVVVAGKQIKPEHAKYFPYRYDTESGPITLFFRDHGLSDAIGFAYQAWDGADAARDLVKRLHAVRSELIDAYGIGILEHACVSIILDGENCWEYYPRNGYEFLDTLYGELESASHVATTTFHDASHSDALPKLSRLKAGSWINGNFRIWIGHTEDNLAWDALWAAREALEDYESRIAHLPKDAQRIARLRVIRAREEIMIAEGSDWCWWYGDEHYSNQKAQFDELFRMHLRAVYVILDLQVPAELLIPIAERAEARGLSSPDRSNVDIVPVIAGKLLNESWSELPNLIEHKHFGSMHRAVDVDLEELKIDVREGMLRMRMIVAPIFPNGASVSIVFSEPAGVMVTIDRKRAHVQSPHVNDPQIAAIADETIEWEVTDAILGAGTNHLTFTIEVVKFRKTIAIFPESGSFECELSNTH